MRPNKITVAIVMLSFGLALAQENSTCLDQASAKIKLEQKITLLRYDGRELTGRLLAIDLASSQVTIHKLDEVSRMTWARLSSIYWGRVSDDTATLQGSDLTTINYYLYGQLRPAPVLGGTLAGALVGGVVGAVIGGTADFDLGFGSSSDNNGAEEGFREGLAFGSAAGLVVGTIFSLLTATTRRIECKQKEVAE